MAMMLKPRPGAPSLDVAEVVRRLRGEFAQVETSTDGVRAYAENAASSFRDQGHVDKADHLDSVKDQGLFVQIADAGQTAMVVVLPKVPLMAGFRTTGHLDALQPLLRRLAAVLGYDLR